MSVSGKGTVSRSGSTGSASGRRVWTAACAASPSVDGDMDAHSSRPLRSGTRRRVRGRERYHDLEDPVLIARASLVGGHLRAELDHAAKRAVLDLDLLVEAARRLGAGALPGDEQLAAPDLEPRSWMCTPASSAFTTARGGSST